MKKPLTLLSDSVKGFFIGYSCYTAYSELLNRFDEERRSPLLLRACLRGMKMAEIDFLFNVMPMHINAFHKSDAKVQTRHGGAS